MFVYPSTESRDQPLSHSLIGRLFASLTPKTDPWIHERSRFLFNGVFAALVAQFASTRIQLLDIAYGSAKTTISLCRKAFDAYQKSFDLTLVDVVRGRKTIATTFYRNPSTFGNIIFRRESLFDWVDKNHSAASVHFDIVLMLQICDVFSRFHIEVIPFREASLLLRREGSGRPFEADVLHPGKLIEDILLEYSYLSDLAATLKKLTSYWIINPVPRYTRLQNEREGKETSIVYLPFRSLL